MISIPITAHERNLEIQTFAGDEAAAWNVLTALQRHGLDNPPLLENPAYKDAILAAQQDWAEIFGGEL